MNSLILDYDADTTFPVSLPTVKEQLRIDHDDYDALITQVHLPAAVEWAEGEMKRSILSKTHRWVLQDFPRTKDQRIWLPRGKTQSVASIAYAPSAGNTTTLTGTSTSPQGTGYREELRGEHGGFVVPNDTESWPNVDVESPAPVLITFDAGWTEAQVPGDIKLALIFYVGDALEITSAADLTAHTNLSVKDRLVSGWRIHKW